jgi:hypothetical protein
MGLHGLVQGQDCIIPHKTEIFTVNIAKGSYPINDGCYFTLLPVSPTFLSFAIYPETMFSFGEIIFILPCGTRPRQLIYLNMGC